LEDRTLLSFLAAASYAVGSSPISVAVADFNGDGIPDLVTADLNSNSVSVLLGNGDGFQAARSFAAGNNPRSVAVGDFNGDGIPDLAVANATSPGTVSVLLGNGNGTFQAARNFPVGTYPDSVVVGDFSDQRGVARTGGVNIGAYQASASAFLLSAPRRVQVGVPFDLTVTAVDPFGQLAVGYIGTVTFSTSDPDPGVVLPADYTFTLDDAGVHTFTDTGLGETTLLTHGHQTITVTDTADGSITGAVTVRVRRNPPAPGPVPHHGDVVWLPARSIHQSFSDSDPLGWDWLDGADLCGLPAREKT
jgi:hypothetical protein